MRYRDKLSRFGDIPDGVWGCQFFAETIEECGINNLGARREAVRAGGDAIPPRPRTSSGRGRQFAAALSD